MLSKIKKPSVPLSPGAKKRMWHNFWIAMVFCLPNFLGFLVFEFVPIIWAMLLSFFQWDSANPAVFVGVDNFVKMFSDETFRISLTNTLYYTVVSVPLTMVFSLGLALLLNNKIKFLKFFRTAYFLPYITSLIAVAVVWNMLFHPTMGPINQVLQAIGISNPPGWTTSVDWAMPAIIIVSVWKNMGYFMVIYLAGLQSVPGELYEAAKIDGATSWEQFYYVTRPMLTPTTFFVCIMLTIQSFKVFDLILAMTGGGPGRATNVLVYYIYKKGFVEMDFGYASAMSMVLFAVVLTITLIQMKAEKKWSTY